MKIQSKAILETTFTVNRKPTSVKKELERILNWKEIYNIHYGFDSGYELMIELSEIPFIVDLFIVPTNQRKTKVVIHTEFTQGDSSFGALYSKLLDTLRTVCSHHLAMGLAAL